MIRKLAITKEQQEEALNSPLGRFMHEAHLIEIKLEDLYDAVFGDYPPKGMKPMEMLNKSIQELKRRALEND